jgi:hypothetical protein
MPFATPVVAVLLLSVVACSSRERAPADTSSPARSETATAVAQSPVTARGIGPLQMGMTLRDARAVVPGLELPAGSDGTGCEFAKSPALPGVLVMVEDGIVVRVDVDTSSVPTAEGIRVGDAIARVRSAYGPRLSSSPNKYTDEPDLRVRSSIPDDTLHEIVFETIGGRIRHYHAGQRPQVRYVEGCS